MSACPEGAADLSLDWLNAVLGTTASDHIEWFDAATIGVGEGFMAQLARLTLKRSDGSTDTMIAKFASTDPNIREMAALQRYYEREHGFYTELRDRTPARTPECLYARLDAPEGPFVLLLEDFAPAVATDQVAGASPELAALVARKMAEVHAAWWNSDDLAQREWALPLVSTQTAGDGLQMLSEALQRHAENQTFARYPNVERLSKKLSPLFRMEPPPPFPFTLTHGDLRADNVFDFGDGEMGLIDWQCCGVGQPASDLARWLVQSITVEDRRAVEQDILREYHEALCAAGVSGYGWRTFSQEYQLNLVVMLIMFSMGVDHVDTSDERAAEVIHQMYARLDAALVDHKVENLLNVLPYMVPFIKFSTWLKSKLARQ